MLYIHFMSTPHLVGRESVGSSHPFRLHLCTSQHQSATNQPTQRRKSVLMRDVIHTFYTQLYYHHTFHSYCRINRLADYSNLINIYTIYNKVFRAIYTILCTDWEFVMDQTEYLLCSLSLSVSALKWHTKHALLYSERTSIS